jgi:hypothetical protein
MGVAGTLRHALLKRPAIEWPLGFLHIDLR